MGRVAIITESASNLPPELTGQYGIHVLPLLLSWQGESLRDGIDISPEEVYQRQASESYSPESEAPDPSQVFDLIGALDQEAEAAVAITHSLRLTRSVQTARLAQQMNPRLPLYVVDSGSADMAQGFVVLETARAALAGASALETVVLAKSMSARVQLLAVLDSSRYLRDTGQVGKVTAAIGDLLKTKPIVALRPRGGRLLALARPRTWQRALDQLMKLILDEVGERPLHAAVTHHSRKAAAAYLAGGLQRKMDLREIYLNHVTPLLGVAAGPMVAVSFWAEDLDSRLAYQDIRKAR